MTPDSSRHIHSDGSRSGSISAAALTLLILGITLLAACGIHRAAVSVRSEIGFVAVVDPSFGPKAIDSLKQTLVKAPYIATIQGRTADEVLHRWEELMGPEELLDINPFLPEFEITVKAPWAKTDSLEAIALRLESLSCVDHVQTYSDTAQNVAGYIASWFLALSIGGAAIAACCLTLLVNITFARLRSRSHELSDRIMLGDNRKRIASSFAAQAVIDGLIASLCASVLLVFLRLYCGFLDPGVASLLTPEALGCVIACLIIAGVLIPPIAAYLRTWLLIGNIHHESD